MKEKIDTRNIDKNGRENGHILFMNIDRNGR